MLMLLLPDMAKPLKPTARTRNEMATPRVCENPTTSSNVASIPNPESHTFRKGALGHHINNSLTYFIGPILF